VVYRVLPPIPGLFEYTMMRGESGEKQKTLARLFEKLFDELAVMVQANYDAIVPAFSVLPAMTRVIPVETAVDAGHDAILPSEDVLALIDRFDPIAVVHCYCRHQKDLLEKPCRVTDERKNCLMFGRTAQFAVDRKFGEPVTKDQARAILAKAKQSGLVHKAFHEKSDPFKDEMAICNCCKCCCETFQVFYRGAGPSLTTTAHIARLDLSLCTGCESCTAMCPMEALTMQGDRAVLEESRCIGCGVCVHHCPAEALSLVRTGLRTACVIPARKP
jgi:ferredoxin